MLWGVWPFPEPRYGASYRLLDRKGFAVDYDMRPATGRSTFWTDLFMVLTTITPQPDYLYAWWLPGAFSELGPAQDIPSRLAYGDVRSEGGQSYHKGTYAHESGHNFGLYHTAKLTLDPDIGWDVLRPNGRLNFGHVQPKTDDNTMNRSGRVDDVTWISASTYEAVIVLFSGPVGPGSPPSPATVLAVPVSSDAASIEPMLEVTRDGWPVTPGSVGSAVLRVLDAQMVELYSTQFEPSVSRGRGLTPVPDEPAVSLVEVPALAAAQYVELQREGLRHDVVTRSLNAPAVTILSPQAGALLDASTIISWTAVDADGDALLAYVQYSHDAGSSWIPLEVRLLGTQMQFDPAWLPGSQGGTGSIRVLVSDGFNTTAASVDNLTLGLNRAPEVVIDQPEDGSQHLAGANVMLIGTVRDPEDGPLPEANVSWYSDRDGFLGNGFILNVTTLSVGAHVIELRAVDSQSLQGIASVTVAVQ